MDRDQPLLTTLGTATADEIYKDSSDIVNEIALGGGGVWCMVDESLLPFESASDRGLQASWARVSFFQRSRPSSSPG